MLLSELTNTIGMKHISPTFRYIMPLYLRLTTFTKPSPKCHFSYLLLFLFCSGAPIITLMTAGALTDLRLPARQLQTCARLMQGWVESAGCPPKKTIVGLLHRRSDALNVTFAVDLANLPPVSFDSLDVYIHNFKKSSFISMRVCHTH